MPTGVAIRDAREQLFDAAERILLREGPNALTSRAVTAEAGVAKGVLHRHFADFDAFLAELILDRAERMKTRAALLLDFAGTATVTDNLVAALTGVYNSIAVHVLALMVARDELRARIREHRPRGLPVIEEAMRMTAAYLAEERGRGRIAADADVDMLALTLLGTSHLDYAGGDGRSPDAESLRRVVTSVLGGVLR
ncbi:MAG TPA: TetR/AcrR family transcriptional regulator [Actinospica sp.]|nr:TetR/AcrR family transcriptional regulator [Actinospica sp.]